MVELLNRNELVELTTEIVTSYLSYHKVGPAEIGVIIGSVAGGLSKLGNTQEPAPAAVQPVVPVRRSISRDHLICLLCGKKQKLLKRHLATAHGMTPPEYRERFGLKPDYPMVARSLSRSSPAHKADVAGCSSAAPSGLWYIYSAAAPLRPSFRSHRSTMSSARRQTARDVLSSRHEWPRRPGAQDPAGSCPETWCRSWAAGISVADRAARFMRPLRAA
jgi:predicted transcriptional regulator